MTIQFTSHSYQVRVLVLGTSEQYCKISRLSIATGPPSAFNGILQFGKLGWSPLKNHRSIPLWAKYGGSFQKSCPALSAPPFIIQFMLRTLIYPAFLVLVPALKFNHLLNVSRNSLNPSLYLRLRKAFLTAFPHMYCSSSALRCSLSCCTPFHPRLTWLNHVKI